MQTVFLCHASEDKPLAEPIQLALANAGYEVFYDERSLPPGGDYHDRIRQAINKCDLFIFLISKASISSGKYTLTELGFAREKWPSPVNRALAVLLEDIPVAEIPSYLSSTTILSAKGNVAAEVRVAVKKSFEMQCGKKNKKVLVSGIAALVIIGISAVASVEQIYATITDGDICGYTEEKQITRPYKWKACPNPSKVLKYEHSETVSKSSGRVPGGYDQNWHCTNVKREKERAVGQAIVWSNLRSSEESNKDWKGHVTYKYHCTIDAKWGPVYKIERWEGCVEEDPVVKSISQPNTCIDKSQWVGWKWRWQ
jgi:hypothetical protein